MKESQIEEKNYKEFKQIHIASDSIKKPYQNLVIYQPFDHLQKILNTKITQDMIITYCQNNDQQFVII